jgi:hypothetical protein
VLLLQNDEIWWVCTVFETHIKFKSREEANIDDLIWKAYNKNIELSVKYKQRQEMHDFDDAAKFYIVKYYEEFLWDVQRSDFAEGQKGRLEEQERTDYKNGKELLILFPNV